MAQGQGDGEHRTTAGIIVALDGTAMSRHDILHDREAYARVIVAHHRIEHVFLGFLWQTDTIVGDTDSTCRGGLIDKHLDDTVGRREHDRIVEQNLYGLTQHITIEIDDEIIGQREERELEFLTLRSRELGALLLHELLQVARLTIQSRDFPLGCLWLFLFLDITLVHHLGLHLVHPLFLHHLHTQALTLHLIRLT